MKLNTKHEARYVLKVSNKETQRILLFADNIYLLKVNNKNISKGVKYVQCYWRRSGVPFVNYKHTSHLFLMFLLFTLNKQMLAGIVIISIYQIIGSFTRWVQRINVNLVTELFQSISLTKIIDQRKFKYLFQIHNELNYD